MNSIISGHMDHLCPPTPVEIQLCSEYQFVFQAPADPALPAAALQYLELASPQC